MLAEPGWVIPAGRYERRYAAFAVSTAKRGDRAYFRALHDQIHNGGAEAMFYELQRMDLGDWHPREIPEALLTNPTLQKATNLQPPTPRTMVFNSLTQRRTPSCEASDALGRHDQGLSRER